MKIKYNLFFICVFWGCLCLYGQQQEQFSIETSIEAVNILKSGDRDIVELKDANFYNRTVGEPYLPVKAIDIVVPDNMEVSEIKIVGVQESELQGEFNVPPVSESSITNYLTNNLVGQRETEDIYSNDLYYPEAFLTKENEGYMGGSKIASILFYPIKYNPTTKKLKLITQIKFQITYSSSFSTGITLNKIAPDYMKNHIQKSVINPEDLDSKLNVFSNKQANISSSSSIDYVIITNNELSDSFIPFVEWKIKKGLNTKVVTTNWIAENYSGIDLPEKIRKFIKNAYQNWGTIWFLLGGDTNIVPVRYAWISHFNHSQLVTLQPKGTFIPTDMYYACLDGNWNADGDATFGEGSWNRLNDGNFAFTSNNANIDSIDRVYDVFVGRIPVQNVADLNKYMQKYLKYAKGENVTSNKSLVFSANSQSIYSYEMDVVANKFPSSILVDKLYECVDGYNNNCGTKSNVLTSLNNSIANQYQLINGYGHGSITAFEACDANVGIQEIDQLQNANAQGQIFYNNHCETLSWDNDCIGEHYLANNNGGIAYIGNTRYGWTGDPSRYNHSFITNVYNNYSIGEALFRAKGTGSNMDGVTRWGFFALNLAGDPEMQIWTNTPQTIGVTLSATSIPCGEGSVSVTVSGLQSASEEMRICLYKKNEVFESRTEVGNGTFTFSGIHPLTVGDLSVTVTAHNYFPVEKTISVTANPNQHVRYKSLSVDDDKSGSSNGNNDGKMDAGETIELTLQLENNGQAQSGNVVASLSCSSPYITLISSQASFGDIPAGQTKTSLTKYAFRIDKDAPELLADDPNAISFFLNISDGNGNSFSNAFGIDVLAPSLKIGNRTIDGGNSIAAGQAVNFYIDLQNLGKGKARGVSATLSTTSSYVQSYTSSPHQYPDIAWGEANKNTLAFQLQTTANYPTNGALSLSLKVQDEFGKVWNLPFNLTERPAVVSGLSFTSVENNIKLTWASLSGISGYNIYRCAADQNGNESGSYVKLNKYVLAMPYYQDDNVSLVSKYYYKVSAVSPTGNEGTLSSPFPAWTSFGQKGLYPVRFDFYFLTWGTNPVDVNNDGYKEVFAVSRYGGHIVGLDHTGRELFDTDNNVTTYNGFAETGIPTDATPAIGDIYGDGKQYLVEPTRDLDHPSSNKLICYSMEDRNGDSKPDVKWEKPLVGKTYRGAILSNLDNSADGSLEIVVGHETGDSIRIFDANGVQLRSKGGINMTYAAMAVADLDGDGQKEIIAPGYGGIYAWHRDFTPFGVNECLYTINDPSYAFVSSVMVCDLDNDGQKEILTTAVKKTTPYDAKVYAIKLDGTLLSGWGLGAQAQRIPCEENYLPRDISVGDLNHDGNLEVVIAGTNVVKVLNKDGQLVAQMAVDNFQPHGCPVMWTGMLMRRLL